MGAHAIFDISAKIGAMPIQDPIQRKKYAQEWWRKNREQMTTAKAERRKAQREFMGDNL